MMRRITIGVILGVLAGILALPALATTGNCEVFNNHSGHVPGSYDYAEFYEDGQLVTTVETFGEDVFVNPAGWDAGEDWDQVNKCDYEETTTTLPEETTTTLPEETTTTTLTETTTTTTNGGTPPTTLPSLIEVGWIASATCETLSAEWGDGIVRVDVYQRLPEGDFGPADGIVPFTESGQEISTVGALADSEWILIPVVLTGYVAVPDQISLFTEVCTPTTVTTVPASPPELPFTGPAGMVGLLMAGGLAFVIGTVLVREFRSE